MREINSANDFWSVHTDAPITSAESIECERLAYLSCIAEDAEESDQNEFDD
jgi:hypothetical protein